MGRDKQPRQARARLVGVLALLALAVVVLPIVFDGDPAEYEQALRPVPPVPAIIVPEVDGNRLYREMQALEEEALSSVPSVREPDPRLADDWPDDFSLDADGLPVAWILQVGSFAEEANARRLLTQLREAGHHSYTVRRKGAEGGERDLIRVMVGPMQSRKKLTQTASEIEEQFHLPKTSVLRYRIDDDRNLVGG